METDRYDPIKKFISDFRSGDVPHELKKREYFRSSSEMRRFKDRIALRRKMQAERRAGKRRDYFFKRSSKICII